MCRWSGQLGPKSREGDRQVPEGFYTITPAQMNPKSAYYLSFNVGYPNTYDRALGRNGGAIMVHGACSSAGCFSMTDKQIAEIYAIAREGFAGGQRAIQMQSYPFRMTAENLAKYRLDPNIGFWKQLKEGSDHFEVTKREVAVGVCGKRYVFNASASDGSRLDPSEPCPALQYDATHGAVLAKQKRDDMKVVELVAQGTKPIRTIYADGGQHPEFAAARFTSVSRPEALLQGPMDIALDDTSSKKSASSARVQTATLKSSAVRATAPETKQAKPTTIEEPVKTQESWFAGLGTWFGATKPSETPPTSSQVAVVTPDTSAPPRAAVVRRNEPRPAAR
jgi:murein L,D-transpeptidase YafK